MKIIYIISALLFITACKSSVKEKVKQGGEKVGETVGEFAEGVKTGVEKAFEPAVELDQNLKDKGIQLGKIILGNDSTGSDNKLSVYIIFEKDIKENVVIKIKNKEGVESGRCALLLEGKKGQAVYRDFKFDVRTNIEADSRIYMEPVK